MSRDQFLIRAKDMLLLVTGAIGVFAIIGKIFVFGNAIENSQKDIQTLKPIVAEHTTKIAVNDERFSQIQSQLSMLNRKLDKYYKD